MGVDGKPEHEPGRPRDLLPGARVDVDPVQLPVFAAGPEHAGVGVPAHPLRVVEPVDEQLNPEHARPRR